MYFYLRLLFAFRDISRKAKDNSGKFITVLSSILICLNFFKDFTAELDSMLLYISCSKIDFNNTVVPGRIRSSTACLLTISPDNIDISWDQHSYVFFFFVAIIINPNTRLFALIFPLLRFLYPLFIANNLNLFVSKNLLTLFSIVGISPYRRAFCFPVLLIILHLV